VQGICVFGTGCRGARLLVWLILNDRVQTSFIAGVVLTFIRTLSYKSSIYGSIRTEKCQFRTEKCQFRTEKCQFRYWLSRRHAGRCRRAAPPLLVGRNPPAQEVCERDLPVSVHPSLPVRYAI
jgi:hypothetical protein